MAHGDFTQNDLAEARRLLETIVESKRGATRDEAIASTARSIGISRWSAWGLYYGKRKSIGYAALAAIRKAYLDLCRRQLSHLEAEIAGAETRCGTDDFSDLGAEVARLVARLREARERAR